MIEFGPSTHILKITLRDVEPLVWRRISVPSDMKLPKLATVLGRAMGWSGMHLYVFDVRGLGFGPPDEDSYFPSIDERKVLVQQVLPEVGAALRWDYDFGDGWEHDVVVESIDHTPDGIRHPSCLAGERACPPEDRGGPPAYEELLEAIGDPTHPEHDELIDWLPAGYDPAQFDLSEADRRVRGR